MALSDKAKVYLKYSLTNQDVTDEVIAALETSSDVSAAVDAAIAAHVALPDPHSQYLTSSEASSAIDAGIAAHVALPDPHSQYLKTSDASSAIDARIAAHVALPDPHVQYLKEGSVIWCLPGGRYATLQQAIDSALHGQTILLGQGSWGSATLKSGVNIVGLDAPKGLHCEVGQLTYAPTTGDANTNSVFLSNIMMVTSTNDSTGSVWAIDSYVLNKLNEDAQGSFVINGIQFSTTDGLSPTTANLDPVNSYMEVNGVRHYFNLVVNEDQIAKESGGGYLVGPLNLAGPAFQFQTPDGYTFLGYSSDGGQFRARVFGPFGDVTSFIGGGLIAFGVPQGQGTTDGSALNFGGTAPARLNLDGCYIYREGGSNGLIKLTNTDATATTVRMTNCFINSSASTGTLLTSSVRYARIYQCEFAGGAKSVVVNSGLTQTSFCSFETNSATEIIQVSAGSYEASNTSLIRNLTAGGSGYSVSAGGVLILSGGCVFDVAAGAGYAVKGAGTVIYDFLSFNHIPVINPRNTNFQNTLTVVSLPTTPTSVP